MLRLVHSGIRQDNAGYPKRRVFVLHDVLTPAERDGASPVVGKNDDRPANIQTAHDC